MKKIGTFIIIFLLFAGCDSINNSPTRRVEEFFNSYQTLDDKLLNNLDYSIESNELNEEEKNTYREIMTRQYRDLTYIIKDEEIDGDNAIVKVEIEVYDYSKSISEASDYFMLHQDEFLDDSLMVSKEKYIDYKLELMKKNKERVKYTLSITLSKKDNKWIMDDISDSDREKIHGIFTY